MTKSSDENYRPPKFNSTNHFVSDEEENKYLITQDEYRKRFQFGQLKNMKINKTFTFGMGSSILKFTTPRDDDEGIEEEEMENPSPLRVSGNSNDNPRASLRSLFGETPLARVEKQFKFQEYADYNADENTDYVEEMNENLRYGQERRDVKYFSASFL